jgi:hypothetical protein
VSEFKFQNVQDLILPISVCMLLRFCSNFPSLSFKTSNRSNLYNYVTEN